MTINPQEKLILIGDKELGAGSMASVIQYDGLGSLMTSNVGGVEINEVPPTDDSVNNAATIFGYSGDKLVSVIKIIDGTQYEKTFGYTGDLLTSISAWVEL